MLKEFIKKMTEWALEKEEEAAKQCAIPLETIENQIKTVQEKRDELKKKCDEQLKELDLLLERLEKIRVAETLRCENKKEKEN